MRGVPATVAWLAEEIGELAQAVRKGTAAQQEHEFADVLAWVASLANQMGIDLDRAIQRYASGCPRCGASAVRVPRTVNGPDRQCRSEQQFGDLHCVERRALRGCRWR